ncbi:TadE/TadG family type IV pilus assembly protein [Bacillus sp. FJAT-29814]|uniref:TadE/TadG family type IV pilus assembly protein n=1 Tax=Bacillus sp. FJAT-29814 TaxID=1729688 RepID=UPI00155F873B|nr:TadE family protein [Bacillus sp. FJAT-29814]
MWRVICKLECYAQVVVGYPQVGECYAQAVAGYPQVEECYPQVEACHPPNSKSLSRKGAKIVLFKREEGSIVVEASLVLPFFLMFIIFLTSMIKLAIYDTALDHATAEATKQIATHLYPVALIKDAAADRIKKTPVGEQFSTYKGKFDDIKSFFESNINLISGLFNSQIGKSYNMGMEKLNSILPNGSGVKEMVEGEAAPLFSPIVRHYLDINIGNEDDLKVTKVTLPSLITGGDAYFGIEVTYKLNLPLPFIEKEVEIKKRAYERVWIGK